MTKQIMMNRRQLVLLDNVISVIKLVCFEEVEGQWVKNVLDVGYSFFTHLLEKPRQVLLILAK